MDRPIRIMLSGKLPVDDFVYEDFDYIRLDSDISKTYPQINKALRYKSKYFIKEGYESI